MSKDSFGFELRLPDSTLGLMIFHKMSPRTHYEQTVTKPLCYECFKHVINEYDNIVIIEGCRKQYNEQLLQYLKKIYNLISMLTFSHDCFNSGS